jgi:hypothetical protein
LLTSLIASAKEYLVPELDVTDAGPSLDDQPLVPSGKPNEMPAGVLFKTEPNKWYLLKAHYTDKNGKPASGYAFPLGSSPPLSFWDYVVFGSSPDGCEPLQFQPVPDNNDPKAWEFWRIRDNKCNAGYHMDCKATGWLYRGSNYDTKFRIVDGKLYCSYWGGPAGSQFRAGLVPDGQYLGMGLPVFTCELEEVKA